MPASSGSSIFVPVVIGARLLQRGRKASAICSSKEQNISYFQVTVTCRSLANDSILGFCPFEELTVVLIKESSSVKSK